MRYIITISLIFLIIAFSCTKSSDNSSSIIGRWKLTQSLADPGDGSGTWTPVNFDYTIQFDADSSAHEYLFTTGDLTLNKFCLPNDSTIILYYSDGRSFTSNYKINGNELTLTGGCIEACGSKYKRTSVSLN